MSSQNIRSLLRAELSNRKISHPHASYSNNKSSLLSCTACHLIIKSETLWEGHLRSANHRRNAQKLREGVESQQLDHGVGVVGVNAGRKRKADDVDLDGRGDGAYEDGPTNRGRKRKVEADLGQDEGGEGRKKTKGQPPPPQPPPLQPSPLPLSPSPSSPSPPPSSSSSRPMNGFLLPASVADNQSAPAAKTTPKPYMQPSGPREASSAINDPTPPSDSAVKPDTSPTRPSTPAASGPGSAPATAPAPAEEPAINEDEWAAFEREVLPLTVPNQRSTPQRPTDASFAATNVTITAAPLSASDLAAQKIAAEADDRRANFRSREEDAEAEREEEGRRLQDEFDVQGEMEERVRRLRERREAIRLARLGGGGGGGGSGEVGEEAANIMQTRLLRQESLEEDDDGDGDGDGGHDGNAASRDKNSHDGNEEQEESEDDDPEEFDAWAWA